MMGSKGVGLMLGLGGGVSRDKEYGEVEEGGGRV